MKNHPDFCSGKDFAISYVVSLAETNIKKKDVKTIVYRSLVKKYGQQDGLKIYNLIKKQL